MSKRKKKASPMRRLAEAIAKVLFVNGENERAERLKLVVNISGGERDLGGWCEAAATNRIEEVLKLNTRKNR